MSLPLVPAPDIVAAVAAYLQGVMGGSLDPTQSSTRVYSDYAPPGTGYPYAVITEGPESYQAQSEDHASTGCWLSDIASGSIQVAFYAPSKAQARSLGREAVRKLSDSQGQLTCQDGGVLSIYAASATSAVLGVEGTTDPAVFLRIVTFNYVQQFLV